MRRLYGKAQNHHMGLREGEGEGGRNKNH